MTDAPETVEEQWFYMGKRSVVVQGATKPEVREAWLAAGKSEDDRTSVWYLKVRRGKSYAIGYPYTMHITGTAVRIGERIFDADRHASSTAWIGADLATVQNERKAALERRMASDLGDVGDALDTLATAYHGAAYANRAAFIAWVTQQIITRNP